MPFLSFSLVCPVCDGHSRVLVGNPDVATKPADSMLSIVGRVGQPLHLVFTCQVPGCGSRFALPVKEEIRC